MLGDGGTAAPLAAAPFAEMPGAPPTDELQALLRRDIGRRLSELVALGWLGRDHVLKGLAWPKAERPSSVAVW